MATIDPAALRFLLDLLPIPGPPGEERLVQEYIVAACGELGVPAEAISSDTAHTHSEYGGNTGNLFVRLKGRGQGHWRLLATHMDTVPLAVGCRPRVEGDRVVNDAPGKALGGDARAGCAALLTALRALQEMKGKHPPTVFLFTIQEEVGLVGARELDPSQFGTGLPAMGFEFDGGPTDKLITGIVGAERLNIDIQGIPTHTARLEKGASAAMVGAIALAELGRQGWVGKVEKASGSGRSNLGILQGGQSSNTVMPKLYGLAEFRSFSHAFRQQMIAAWQDAFRRAADQVTNDEGSRCGVSFSPGPTYEAFSLPPDAPAVLHALAAARHCGIQPELASNEGGMDSNHLVALGIPTAAIGIGAFGAHSEEEYVDLKEYETCCRMALALATLE